MLHRACGCTAGHVRSRPSGHALAPHGARDGNDAWAGISGPCGCKAQSHAAQEAACEHATEERSQRRSDPAALSSLPAAASLRQDTGCTYAAGTETYVDPGDSTKSKTLTYSPSGSAVSTSAHIYNSFEAGFSNKQDKVIEGWGCSTPSDLYDSAGGLDLGLAESKVRKLCYDSVAWSFPNVQADC